MQVPPSSHFTPIDLSRTFNARRRDLVDVLGQGADDPPSWSPDVLGLSALRGIPFHFGDGKADDVVLLRPGAEDVTIELPGINASYIVFVHAVADRLPSVPQGFDAAGPTMVPVNGTDVGGLVSEYSLLYSDGTVHHAPIIRRLGIQQRHISWGASPFAAVPARGPHVFSTHGEDMLLGRVPSLTFGWAEARTLSGRQSRAENLWLYAMPNPFKDKQLTAVKLHAGEEESAVFAASATLLDEHPLRPYQRRKLRLTLPEGVELNRLGEIDTDDRGDQIGIDLGTVISARAVLDYRQKPWVDGDHDLQPVRSEKEVIVEYAAHPDAALYLRLRDGTLARWCLRTLGAASEQSGELPAISVQPANRRVQIEVVDRCTGTRVAARLHMHGANGEYLPPKGHHRKVNTVHLQDDAAEFANGLNQYAYINGYCTVDLPLGPVFFEIVRGFEIRPLRRVIEIEPSTEKLTFELDKVLRWRERGWVSADTHVHFLSPQTALLEGQAEDVNVVNLLATQWGEFFTNVGDFDGRTTLGAKDFGGDGEFLVRVGTENRMQVLGHISLLGYDGDMIEPLCTGGSHESAIGDSLESTMAIWADRCRRQGGIVVLPHSPNPQAERAADIVLGLVDAIEMMSSNPRDAQISAFSLADWYRYLNIGYQLPLAGGSDKMDAASLLGGVRTYVALGTKEFTYRNWLEAIRSGDTFVTVGPLIELTVEGQRPGSRVRLTDGGGTLGVTWNVESVSVAPTRVELIQNGRVIHQQSCDSLACQGSANVRISESCWLALRVHGSVAGRDDDIAAHTSAVFVEVDGKPIFAEIDAIAVLRQIEGSIAYIDTLAPHSEAAHQGHLRRALELAHHQLHGKLHQLGAEHHHTPVHSVHISREH